MTLIYRVVLVVVAIIFSTEYLSAQLLPERRLVRNGNEQFQRRNFYNSFNRYSEALEHAPNCYEAQYNRANAYLQLMMANPQDSTLTAETSNNLYESIINNPNLSPEQRGEVMRNIGESLFMQQDYEPALNAFRESLKLNPNDAETKKNYVLTKRIVDQKRNMEQQQNQQNQQDQQDQQDQQQNNNQNNQNKNQDKNQDNDNNNDQNKDNNQNNQNQENDKNKDNNQNQDQNNNKDQNKNEDKDQGNNDNKPNNGSNGSGEKQHKELSHEQERMLDVIQGEEDKTQDKIKDAERGTIVYGKKNW